MTLEGSDVSNLIHGGGVYDYENMEFVEYFNPDLYFVKGVFDRDIVIEDIKTGEQETLTIAPNKSDNFKITIPEQDLEKNIIDNTGFKLNDNYELIGTIAVLSGLALGGIYYFTRGKKK